jgi:hypothetical protein
MQDIILLITNICEPQPGANESELKKKGADHITCAFPFYKEYVLNDS